MSMPASPASPTTAANLKRNPIVHTAGPDVYPFAYIPQHHGCCQTLKMIIVGFFLFIPRVLICFFGLFTAWLVATFMICCVGHEALAELPLVRPISWFFLRLSARIMLFGMGFWWISVDDQRDPEYKKNHPKPTVIIGNHHTFIDGFAMLSMEACSPVGKASIMEMPIFGKIFRAVQVCPVNRLSRDSNRQTAETIRKRARWQQDQPAEVIKKHGVWPSVLIFPEGTNTNLESIITFKAGAFMPMVPVQPLLIDFRQNHLNLAWVGDVDVLKIGICMLCQVYNKLTVTYLPAQLPEEGDTPIDFQERARTAMAKHFGIPTSNHSYYDVILQMDAIDLSLTPQAGAAVQMGSLGLPLEEVRLKIKEFAKLDKNGDGVIDEEEFNEFMGLEETEGGGAAGGSQAHDVRMTRLLLKQWDQNGDGKIDLNEFLLFNKCLKASMENDVAAPGSNSGATVLNVPPLTFSPRSSPPAMSHLTPASPTSGSGGGAMPSALPPTSSTKTTSVDVTDPHRAGSSMELRRLFAKYFTDMQVVVPSGLNASSHSPLLSPESAFASSSNGHKGASIGSSGLVVRRRDFIDHITANLVTNYNSAAPPSGRRPSATSDEDANWLFNSITHDPQADSMKQSEFMDYCHQHPAVVITLFNASAKAKQKQREEEAQNSRSPRSARCGSNLLFPIPVKEETAAFVEESDEETTSPTETIVRTVAPEEQEGSAKPDTPPKANGTSQHNGTEAKQDADSSVLLPPITSAFGADLPIAESPTGAECREFNEEGVLGGSEVGGRPDNQVVPISSADSGAVDSEANDAPEGRRESSTSAKDGVAGGLPGAVAEE